MEQLQSNINISHIHVVYSSIVFTSIAPCRNFCFFFPHTKLLETLTEKIFKTFPHK